ncbi:protein IMPACT-like isoform X1 [Maniola hyperantus]|uniref:protein IMPACT-like isoform X1 n=2 Tax=Aphantopus hyperantus TaxID=2795564 RepID=UPI0015685773|nr:protein IMPACT-like [Maniola hyperantus]
MESDNLSKQIEEVEALSSIYGEDWTTDSEATKSYSIKIKDNKNEVILYVTMIEGYPSLSPPKYELSAPWMDRKVKENLHYCLDEIYLDNLGETIIFQWVEKIREILQTIRPVESEKEKILIEETLDLSQIEISCPEITHGEVIVDRKSSFQGHAAEVHSIDDINAVLAKLKQNKKIRNATHNMYAYRIEKKTEKGTTMVQDCNDDGEAHAGGRMLHLLQILDQKCTLVVVSRWYGGIQLGPDRFRHINNATRQVIQQAGLLKK